MKPDFSEDILAAPDEEIVCWCSEVSKGDVLEAKRQGAQNMADIRQMTGACTMSRCKELSPRGRCCSKEIMLLLEVEIK